MTLATALAAAAILAIAPVSQAHACKSHEELIELTAAQLADADPCSVMGRAYQLGVTGYLPPDISLDPSKDAFQHMMRLQSLSELELYYQSARIFFAREADVEIGDWEGSDFLNAHALMLTASQTVPQGIDPARRLAYETAPLMALGLYGGLTKSSGDLVTQILWDKLNGSIFAAGRHLWCFLRHDIPRLDVDVVMGSASFRACVEDMGG